MDTFQEARMIAREDDAWSRVSRSLRARTRPECVCGADRAGPSAGGESPWSAELTRGVRGVSQWASLHHRAEGGSSAWRSPPSAQSGALQLIRPPIVQSSSPRPSPSGLFGPHVRSTIPWGLLTARPQPTDPIRVAVIGRVSPRRCRLVSGQPGVCCSCGSSGSCRATTAARCVRRRAPGCWGGCCPRLNPR